MFEKIKMPAKNIITVASGKGGVGKSTVAANLAVALAKKGKKTGLLDADIYGPSTPTLFGINEQPVAREENGNTYIKPVKKYDIEIMSIGFLVRPEQALIWRGPMAAKTIKQFLEGTDWSELDYLVIDLPPGTGDIHLTIVQSIDVTGAVIVTTPQQLAIDDVRKAATMFANDKINVPVLGIIENMAYFTPPELPDNKYYIFGKGGGEKLAKEINSDLIGSIPIVGEIAESGDKGVPLVTDDKHILTKQFFQLIESLEKKLNQS